MTASFSSAMGRGEWGWRDEGRVVNGGRGPPCLWIRERERPEGGEGTERPGVFRWRGEWEV